MPPKSSVDPQLHEVALTGLGDFQGDDAVAEATGIPVNPETLASHTESAQKVAKLLLAAHQAQRPLLLQPGAQPIQGEYSVSPAALLAQGGEEHAELGPVPPHLVV